MIIIMCGMDRCGKDTQIKNVISDIIEKDDTKSVHVMHYSNIPIKNINTSEYAELAATQYIDMFKIMEKLSKMKNVSVIFNRAHLGEMVYGYIYRQYNADWIYDIEEHFEKLLTEIKLVVLVDSGFKSVTERDDGMSFSKKDIEKAKIEVERFTLAYNMSNISNKILIDIKENDIEQTKIKILEFINNA